MPRKKKQRPPRNWVGAKLADLRGQSGLTYLELAAAAGVSLSHIQQIEKGEADPSFMDLNRLFVALGYSWKQFGKHVHEQQRSERAARVSAQPRDITAAALDHQKLLGQIVRNRGGR